MSRPIYLSRRRALQLAFAGAGCALGGALRAAGPVVGQLPGVEPEKRWVSLSNTHTGESLEVAYRDASGLLSPALGQLNWLLRDFRAGEQHPMDAQLFDQLSTIAMALSVDPCFEVISGYRSPRTNAALADAGRGVATHSLHMEGRAIDVRLKGVDCASLRDVALAMGRGGVGYYRASNFVHVDTGRVRTWSG